MHRGSANGAGTARLKCARECLVDTWVQLGIVIAGYTACRSLGGDAGWVLAVVMLALLPASIAVLGMLAIEWAKNGIRVNAIAPGSTLTPTRLASLRNDPTRRQGLIDRIPVGRFCSEEEIAGLASYLASPQAEYITGQTLLIDGGLTAY